MTKAQVDYELVIYDELPAPSPRGGGKSILNEQLGVIKENKEVWGKAVRIGLYTQGTAATAAKNVLQQRFGRSPAVSGWKFHTRPVPSSQLPDADVHRGLFAVYTPDAIVEGAAEAHEKAEAKRLGDLKTAREAKIEEEEEEYEDEDEDEDEDEMAMGR
jgi:hypothetical protein